MVIKSIAVIPFRLKDLSTYRLKLWEVVALCEVVCWRPTILVCDNIYLENFHHCIKIFCIFVGPGTQDKWAQKELRAMASDPDDSNLYNLDDFSGLQNVTSSLLTTVCNSQCFHDFCFYWIS